MLPLTAYTYSAFPLPHKPPEDNCINKQFTIHHKPEVHLPKEWVIEEQVSNSISVKATGSECSSSNSISLSNAKTVRHPASLAQKSAQLLQEFSVMKFIKQFQATKRRQITEVDYRKKSYP